MLMLKIMRKIFFFILLLTSVAMYSQQDAWVYFTDKPDSEFYFSNPFEMLTQRALDRRTTQNIPLDLKDVPIHEDYIDQVAQNVAVLAKSKWLNAIHVRGSQSEILALAAFSFVDHIGFADRSLNPTGRNSAANNTHRSNKVMETQVNFPYGNSANQIQMLNGHLLHQQNYTGAGKIIAVLDAGFPTVNVSLPFKRLRDNNQILGGYNFVDRNTNFYTASSHGTMVLSTMGGYVQNQLVGTAPDASYYLFITEDADNENPIEESLWVEAAERADSLGVDVINTSLGYSDYDNPAYSYTYDDMNGTTSFIARGADIAFSRGMVVVVSAGNSGASFEPHIGTPGDAINVLTVGAVDSAGNYAQFSSIGPSADGRVKPDVVAKGQAATVANTSGAVVTASGTSFSGPIMAGMVATFWQSVPSMTNVQVVEFIKQSASQYSAPTDELGYGIPDFQQALQMALLSVSEHASNQFVLYPNPVHDQLSLSPENSENANITFYNALGQKVIESEISGTHSADLSQLAGGMYFYRILSAGGTQSGKIFKE
jgi:serine protease AprX